MASLFKNDLMSILVKRKILKISDIISRLISQALKLSKSKF